MRTIEDLTLLLLVIAVSLAFAWILWPFFSAVLWATVLAIVFAPLYRLARLGHLASPDSGQSFSRMALIKHRGKDQR